MNQIVKVDQAPTPLRYEDIERLAASVAKSGLFGMKTMDQALALMMIAQAEGLHPALAARDYDIIQGRPAKKAEAMQRDFLMAGGKIEWHALSDTIADATFSHPQGGTVRISWDIQRAAVAGLASKDNYKKFPRQMLRSRTVSEGVRTVWPLATSGMYVPEEAGDIQPQFTGTTIDAESETARTRSANAEDGDRLEEAERKRAAAAATPRGARVAERAPAGNGNGQPATRTKEQWEAYLAKVRAGVMAVHHRAEVEEIARRPTVADVVADPETPGWVRLELSSVLVDGYARFSQPGDSTIGNAPENDPGEHPDGGPRVAGEHLVGAG